MTDRLHPPPETRTQRAERYQELARLALRAARNANDPELRKMYTDLAEGWNALAEDVWT